MPLTFCSTDGAVSESCSVFTDVPYWKARIQIQTQRDVMPVSNPLNNLRSGIIFFSQSPVSTEEGLSITRHLFECLLTLQAWKIPHAAKESAVCADSLMDPKPDGCSTASWKGRHQHWRASTPLKHLAALSESCLPRLCQMMGAAADR